ncbi:nitroreductase family deazaflavin-dependent oxidoreductase [Actinomadura rudentiformis]|uniref:Nitroreductase family deazaflavin-dependent oxidoreductase n=1 Tax=Actinomadura rudentiformis TaxID=359158 RepID=A0A6H9YS14_9ACTN|nr:nitroreductase family deazaflavin-dependent oxidoreductase [Actinomadura rudentiformis]KAB2344679.1 nitroreductase family deazaflavin-dependent oxidoreductase [Actinomadura rudentiformis]
MSVWDAEVIDSPEPSVAEHVRRYLATDGEDGFMEGGVTNLLLTTVGRKSGQLRRTGLFFGQDEDRFVLIGSSFSGGPKHPSWYLNLVAHPEAQVQIKGERFLVRARTAEGEERARLWRLMTSWWPAYDTYQARSTREIPVVVLERI